MGTTTTTYALNKPTVGGDEDAWGADLNTNADKIDDLFDGTTAIKPNLDLGLWKVGGVAVTSTAAELNTLDGITASTAELNIMDGITATTAEINKLAGTPAGLTATEIGYLDGVTSPIQTQLDAKQASDADLTALAALGSTGIAVRTGAGTWAQRQIVSSDSSVTITNPAGIAGDIDFSFAGDSIFALASAHAGADVTTAQDLFPEDITLDENSIYQYELVFSQLKTAGATSHRIRYLYGGTVGVSSMQRNFYMSWDTSSTAAATLAWNGIYTSAAEQEFTANIAFANVTTWMQERGIVVTSTGGTFIPQYRLTVAPGGAYSTRVGSYFRLRKLGASGSNIAIGAWA